MRLLFLFITALFSSALLAQSMPGPKQSRPIAIVGATAHIGNGTAIKNAVVTFDDGIITYAGPQTGAPDLAGHEVINVEGQDVYPGFIAMDTQLGLIEVDAVRATVDKQELGYFNPNSRTLIAFNTDSEVVPTVRTTGVLIAQVAPQGNGLAGQSSAMMLDGWNWEDAVLGADEGMFLDWPGSFHQTGWWAAPGGLKKNKKYDGQVTDLREYFAEAKAYANTDPTTPNNPRFRSMVPVFKGERTLYIRANYAREIEDAVRFAESFGIKPVIMDARDAYLVKDMLKQKDITVVCGPIQALPMREDELVSQPFLTPAELHKAGIPIAFGMTGAWEQRRVPHNAGQAVGFGLPYEEAVKALTQTPAMIMGIEDKVGTLEKGKHATLFISTGDALDMRTNKVHRAFMQGRVVDLSSRQTKLADKYRKKYSRGE